MNLVQELRNKGYKVRVTHFRRYWSIVNNKPTQIELPRYQSPGLDKALPYGGRTQVSVFNNGKYLEAESICSVKDQFIKREGVSMALAKIIMKCL